MKALVRGPGGVRLVEVDEPRAAEGEVVVAVHSCGICGSDVHMAEAGLGRPGTIPGHEFAGRLARLGPGVSGWQAGQPVAVNPLGACGRCEYCARGIPILCRGRPNLGLNAPGGFAEQVVVHASQLSALPSGVSLEHASRVEPLAVAVRAIAEARPADGDNALVFGVGPIGLCVILALRATWAGTIVAVGRASAGRRATAARIGADVVLDSRDADPLDYVRQSGLSVAQAYECSGDPRALEVCCQAVRACGTVVGVALGRQPSGLTMHSFVSRGLRLLSACAYDQRDYGRALELIASGAADVEPLVSQRVSLEEAPAAFVRLRQPGDLVSVLVQPGLSD